MHNEGNYKQGEKLPSEWEKIIANEVTDKELSSKIYKQLMQLNTRTWNVRSMNQGKLEVVKQEMARVNVDILGISKLK